MRTYYKVVKPSLYNDAYQSARIHCGHPELRTIYRVGEWATSPFEGSKLFVFDNLQSAIQFRIDYSTVSVEDIFECECKGISKVGFFQRCLSIKALKQSIKLRKQKKKWTCDNPFIPNGTAFADSVKLLRKVS